MSNKYVSLIAFYIIGVAFADDYYISSNNYIQNQYNTFNSFAGTQKIIESQILNQSLTEKFLTEGTYNLVGNASYGSINGINNWGYGVNLFAQSGQINGFALGGELQVINPFFANQINTAPNDLQYQFLPTNQVIAMSQLYLEYQYNHVFQADVGLIQINTPWLNSSYNISSLGSITYSGALFNIQALDSLLITAFAINGMRQFSSTTFDKLTMYNQTFDYGTGTANINSANTPGAIGIGAQFSPTKNYAFNLWGYQFYDYANMLYADNKYTANFTNKFNITFAAQVAVENANGTNILNQPELTFGQPYGTPGGNILGAQLGFNYDIYALTLSYNSLFGSQNSYAGGGFVSPYTYQIATDPLYTTSTIAGMVEKSAGNAYKIAPSILMLDKALTITPSYAYYATTQFPVTQEYDFNIQYIVPQIKGLNIYGIYAFMQSSTIGQSVSEYQLMLTYIY